jgi:hypothetical protein
LALIAGAATAAQVARHRMMVRAASACAPRVFEGFIDLADAERLLQLADDHGAP